MSKLTKILAGIDKTETESDNGWWETSTGAEFGRGKLEEIKALKLSPDVTVEIQKLPVCGFTDEPLVSKCDVLRLIGESHE